MLKKKNCLFFLLTAGIKSTKKLVLLQSAAGEKRESGEWQSVGPCINPPFVLWPLSLEYPQEGVCA